jgi:hypothetical protein
MTAARRHLITAAAAAPPSPLLAIDSAAWQRRFLQQWPTGNNAHASYFRRLTRAPAHRVDDAVRAEE